MCCVVCLIVVFLWFFGCSICLVCVDWCCGWWCGYCLCLWWVYCVCVVLWVLMCFLLLILWLLIFNVCVWMCGDVGDFVRCWFCVWVWWFWCWILLMNVCCVDGECGFLFDWVLGWLRRFKFVVVGETRARLLLMFNKDVVLKMLYCKLYCRVEIVKMMVFWILCLS